MKKKWVEVREGEDMGPIDWDHPEVARLKDDRRRCYSADIDLYDVLRDAEKHPENWKLTTGGGIPRCGFRRVIAVRMYDGGPYWKPTPSVFLEGMFGPHWEPFSSLSDAVRALPGKSRPDESS